MNIDRRDEDLSEKIQIALDKAIKEIIEREKARDGYLVIADKDGKPIKVSAKDL
jgi:hypothetical protein